MATAQEQSYVERLNISTLSIAKIKELIKLDIKNTLKCWKAGIDMEKQCFHIIGPAGVGKTQICYQIADEISEEVKVPFEVIMVKAPVLSRDDFIIPFPTINSKNDFTDASFKMLYSDFVPKTQGSYGLFVIDEFSRGDHSLQQLLWQVQNEYKIHLMDFPQGWFVISIDNPDDAEYQIDTMEDAAGLRRQLHVYTEVSVRDFLDYAISNNFHKSVVEFIQTHPDFIYDFQSQKKGSVYANPASYEKLSQHMWKMENNGGIDEHFQDIEILASGLLNVNKASLFMSFLRDNVDIIPSDIFYNFETLVKHRIKKMLNDNDNASLGNVVTSFLTYLITSMPAFGDKEVKNVGDFLSMMPIDTAAIFVTELDNLDRQKPPFKYISQLHTLMSKTNKNYRTNFYEAAEKCSKGR